MRTKLLFICSRNRWRSPTAEALVKGHQSYDVRSAGTSEAARVKVNDGHVRWADMIFVMENRHRQLLLERFCDSMRPKMITVLDIPDEFGFMDEGLVALLRERLAPHLDEL